MARLTLTKKWFRQFKTKIRADITEVPVLLASSHFSGLDGLRGLSIIIVIAGHFGMYKYKGFFNYFNGEMGVQIFFVISGFLITSLLLKEKVKRGTVSFKNFYIRRVLRIMPAAYFFLLILMIFNNKLELGITRTSFLTSFLYLKNIPLKHSTEWFTGHFWSLSVEEQFYIFLPVFIVTRTNWFCLFAVLLIVSIPILNILGFHNIGVFYSNHMVHFLTFAVIILFGKGTASILVGSLYSILLYKKVIVLEKIYNGYFLSIGLLVFSFLLLTRITYFYVEFISIFFFPFLVGYVILLNLKGKNLLHTLLDNNVLKKIGTLSYSLYIWQEMFTSSHKWGFFRYFDLTLVKLVFLLALAVFSYVIVEKYFLKFKRKFKYV